MNIKIAPKLLLIPVFILILVIFGIIVAWFKSDGNDREDFTNEARVEGFLDSTPLSGEVYAAQPLNITLNFSKDVFAGSKISVVFEDGREWGEGENLIEDVHTALIRNLKPGMPDGQYSVKYQACFRGQECHVGQFKFAIDSTKRGEYQDLRGQTGVIVKMEDFKFNPGRIVISPGTEIIWENVGESGHFVNTETHPEHTYYPIQNSREIKSGDSFSVKFDKEGQYNYHCSAHVPERMLGSVVVSR